MNSYHNIIIALKRIDPKSEAVENQNPWEITSGHTDTSTYSLWASANVSEESPSKSSKSHSVSTHQRFGEDEKKLAKEIDIINIMNTIKELKDQMSKFSRLHYHSMQING